MCACSVSLSISRRSLRSSKSICLGRLSVPRRETERRTETKRSKAERATLPAVLPARPRVAVLEDHPLVLDTVCVALRSAGLNVVLAAGDSESFFRLGPEAALEVIVLDLRIETPSAMKVPEPGADDLLSRIARQYPDVRIVVFTADRRSSTRTECFRQGVWAFLPKLMTDLPTLADTVCRVARGERMLNAGVPDAGENNPDPLLQKLTARERQVLAFVSLGFDNLKIAAHLGVGERTVKAHLASLYRKTATSGRVELALFGVRVGIEKPDET